MLLGDMGFKYEAPVVKESYQSFRIRHLFARELQELNKIDIQHIGTDEMILDIFTKPLPEKQFVYLRVMYSPD